MSSKIIRKTLVAAVALTAGMLLAGCEPPGITGAEAKLPEGEQSPGFLDRISSQETVSENDAMRGLLMLLSGQDEAQTFTQRVEDLQKRGVVSSSWSFQADRPITKGRLAYMIYQACKIPGGVILTLAGPSQRYCLRELQYRGMMAQGTFYTSVSGMEYVAVLSRADTWLETGDIPAIIRTSWDK